MLCSAVRRGADDVVARSEHYQDLHGSCDVGDMLPEARESQSPVQALIVCKLLQPKLLVPAMRAFVVSELGPGFTDMGAPDLRSCLADAGPTTPIVILESSGADALAAVISLAASHHASVHSVSMGRHQGSIAEALIDKARREVSLALAAYLPCTALASSECDLHVNVP